jgi:Rod binding domain-containing protein
MDTRLAAATAVPASPAGTKPDENALRLKAQELEASFLSEMLKYSGLGETRDSFGGGVGEEQFSSFLTDEYARIMEKAGGIGLAESIFHSLQKGAENAQ